MESEPETVQDDQQARDDAGNPEGALRKASPAELLLTPTMFADFGLPEALMKGVELAGFTHCTPIQEKTLPLSLAGKDVAGQAQTGTGKTAAFLITIFHRLEGRTVGKEAKPRALIIAPTRELVQQIDEESRILGKYTGFSVLSVFGGIDYKKQERLLRQGVDIIVATPGRLIDYMKQNVFSPKFIEMLVIDEADRMFDMGFVKDLRFILRRLPPYSKRQSMLFSATLGYRVMELTYEFMNLPEEVAIEPESPTLENISESLYHVERRSKFSLLLGLLARNAWERVLIFCNTKSQVEWLEAKLTGNGYSAEGITGDLPQRKRLSIMKQYKAGKLSVLVATDVASRGIHVEDIDAVINYDLPQDAESYIHRIGRTGRAGKTGKAVALADETYVLNLESIERLLKRKIDVEWAEDEWFLEDKAPNKIQRRPRAGAGQRKSPRRTQPRSRKGNARRPRKKGS